MLLARRGKRVLYVAPGGSRTVAGAEHLRNDVREDVGRPAEAVDPGDVDGEVERGSPALAAQLRLDHAVHGVYLVVGLVIDVTQPAERLDRLRRAVERECQLGNLDRRLDVRRPVRDHLPPCGEGVLESAVLAIHADEAAQRSEIAEVSLEHELEMGDRVVEPATRPLRVGEIDDGGGVVRPALDYPLDGTEGRLRPALREQRVGEVAQHVRVVRLGGGGTLQERDRVVAPRFDTGLPGEAEQRGLLRRRLEQLEREGAAARELAVAVERNGLLVGGGRGARGYPLAAVQSPRRSL